MLDAQVYIDNLVVQLSDHDELRAAASSDHTAAFDSLVSVDGQCGLGRLVDRLPRLRLLGCVCDDPPLFEPLAATHPHLTALHLKVVDLRIFGLHRDPRFVPLMAQWHR